MTKVVTVQSQQRWEYHFEARRTETSLLILINELGQQGWELVDVLNYKDAKAVITWGAFLKRPSAGPAPAAQASQSGIAVQGSPTPTANGKAEALQGFDLSGHEFELKKE
jgi:hypothetical protein